MLIREDLPIRGGFLRRYGGLLSALQHGLDLVAVVASLYLATYWRTGGFAVQYQVLAIVAGLTVAVVYRWTGTYSNLRFGGILEDAKALLQPWLIVLVCLVILAFLTKTTELFSRKVVVLWAVAGYMSQVLVHSLIRVSLRTLRERGFNRRYAAIIGTDGAARRFAERLLANPWLGVDVVGLITSAEWDGYDDPADAPELRIRRLGSLEDLEAIVSSHSLDMLYIALPVSIPGAIEKAAQATMRISINTHWVPDLDMFQLINHSVSQVGGQPVITLFDTPFSGFRSFFKWFEDNVGAALLLVIFSLPMALIAAAVKLTSPGPVFFLQRRHGLDGRAFDIIKFRTMVVHEHDRHEPLVQAYPDDPRVTALGAFLRRTSLDELPQLINVVLGHMSLVGPRPHALEHNEYYRQRIHAYMLRHRIKPGMTGLAQVYGYRGETPSDEDMRRRIQYDILYINNWSPWLDIKILFLTLACVFNRHNAY